MVLAARTNWGLNDDGEARKANFRYHRISVFAGIDGINKTGEIGLSGRGPVGNSPTCVPQPDNNAFPWTLDSVQRNDKMAE